MPKNFNSGLCFSSFMYHKKPNLRFYSSLIACQQYWLSWTNLFRIKSLNVKFSKYQKQSPEGVLLKKVFLKILQNSLKNIRYAVLNLTKKILQHYVYSMCFPKNFADVLRTPILYHINRLLLLKYLLKIKIAPPDNFSEAAVRRYFSK